MLGEYALYLDGKVVALVCDDHLFLKLTPGALDDPDSVITELMAIATDLPPSKPGKPKT
jgi:hypothetical protein